MSEYQAVTLDPNYVMPIEEKLAVTEEALQAYREMLDLVQTKHANELYAAYEAIRDLVGVGVFDATVPIATLKGLNRDAYRRATNKHAETICKAGVVPSCPIQRGLPGSLDTATIAAKTCSGDTGKTCNPPEADAVEGLLADALEITKGYIAIKAFCGDTIAELMLKDKIEPALESYAKQRRG